MLYLGADLPPQEWVTAAAHHGAHAAVLAVPTQGDIDAASRTARALLAAAPEMIVAVGGYEQHAVSAPVRSLGHDIVTAAETLVSELANSPRRESVSQPDAP